MGPQPSLLCAALVASVGLVGCGARSLDFDFDGDEALASAHEAAPSTQCLAPSDYEPCVAATEQLGQSDALAAIGLGCGPDPSAAIVLAGAAELAALDPDSWRVVSAFGHAKGERLGGRLWAPRQPSSGHNVDGQLLLLSTGHLPAPGPDGALIVAKGTQVFEGANLNADALPLPSPLSPLPGSDAGAGGTPTQGCDGVNDCADSLGPLLGGGAALHDQLSLRAQLEVPEGTGSIAVELALFSAEFPEFVDSPFGDVFVVWITGELFTGNLALVEGRALTPTALAEAGWVIHEGDDPALAGTGFEGFGGSDWMTLRGPVVGGEMIEVVMVLADVGDAEVGTVVGVDDLRWECERCLFVDGGCGLSIDD